MCKQPLTIFSCGCRKPRLESEIDPPLSSLSSPLARYGSTIVEPCPEALRLGHPCPPANLRPHGAFTQAVKATCVDCLATTFSKPDKPIKLSRAAAWAVKHNLMKVQDEQGFERDEYRVTPEVALKLRSSKTLRVDEGLSVSKRPGEEKEDHGKSVGMKGVLSAIKSVAGMKKKGGYKAKGKKKEEKKKSEEPQYRIE